MQLIYEKQDYRVVSKCTQYPSWEYDGRYEVRKFVGKNRDLWGDWKHVKSYSTQGRCTRYISKHT